MNLFQKVAKSFFAKNQTKSEQKKDWTSHIAVSDQLSFIGRLPDNDAVLQSAGVARHQLAKLLTDDEIYQCVQTRLESVLSKSWRIEQIKKGPELPVMMLIRPFVRDIMTAAWQARLFGYSVSEAVYTYTNDGFWTLKFFGEKPREWFEPQPDGSLRFFPTTGTTADGQEVDTIFKFFLTRSGATYAQPKGDALLSKLYWPWFFRTSGWGFWAKFLERFGAPLLVGQSTDTEAMAAALVAAHRSAVISVGPDDAVQTVTGGAGNNGQAFADFETATLRRIQKVLLGQTLTSGTDGGSGNRALGSVHADTFERLIQSDLQMILPTLQKVTDAICLLNEWPQHQFIFQDAVALEEDRAARDVQLYSMGVRLSDTYFKEAYSLSDDDFTMAASTPQSGVANSAQPQKFAATFASKAGIDESQMSAHQSELDALAKAAFDGSQQPIEGLLELIDSANSPEDLEAKLFDKLGHGVSNAEFRNRVANAIFAADVLGFVSAKEQEKND